MRYCGDEDINFFGPFTAVLRGGDADQSRGVVPRWDDSLADALSGDAMGGYKKDRGGKEITSWILDGMGLTPANVVVDRSNNGVSQV
jgi:hypothetical protein